MSPYVAEGGGDAKSRIAPRRGGTSARSAGHSRSAAGAGAESVRKERPLRPLALKRHGG